MNVIINFLKDYFISLPVLLGAFAVAIFVGLISYYFWKSDQNLQSNLVDILSPGFSFSRYKLVSGGQVKNYFDLDKVLSDPEKIDLICDSYIELINNVNEKIKFDKLAFIETFSGPVGALTSKDLIVSKTRIPALVVRPEKRVLVAAIKGKISSNDETAVIVSDLTTTGSGIIRAAKKLRKMGINVPAAVVLILRSHRALEELSKENIDLYYYSEYKEALSKVGKVSKAA